MNKLFDIISEFSGWLLFFVPFPCFLFYDAIESRWDAYTRRRNYEELKLLNELREKSIITQREFDEKKGQLLGI